MPSKSYIYTLKSYSLVTSNACIRKQEWMKNKWVKCLTKEVKKKKQNTIKGNRREELVKIKAEMNELEKKTGNRLDQQRDSKTGS